MNEISNKEYEILLKEYELHRQEVQLRIDHRMRGSIFILTAIFIAFGLGLKDNITVIFLIFPWFLIGFIAYVGHQLMCGQLSITYLKDLEKRLKFLDYERCVTAKILFNPPYMKSPNKVLLSISQLPYAIAFGISVYKATAWYFNQQKVFTAFFFLIFSFVAILIVIFYIGYGLKKANMLPQDRKYEGQ